MPYSNVYSMENMPLIIICLKRNENEKEHTLITISIP